MNVKQLRLGVKSKERNVAAGPGSRPVQGIDHSCNVGKNDTQEEEEERSEEHTHPTAASECLEFIIIFRLSHLIFLSQFFLLFF